MERPSITYSNALCMNEVDLRLNMYSRNAIDRRNEHAGEPNHIEAMKATTVVITWGITVG